MDQIARLACLVGLGPGSHLFLDRPAQPLGCRHELAVDLRHRQPQRPFGSRRATSDQSYGRLTGPASWRIRRRRRSLSCAVERLGSGDLNARLPQQGQSSFTHVLDGKAIFTHHDVARSRRTEAVDAKHITVIADVAMPALRRTRFDRKSRTD